MNKIIVIGCPGSGKSTFSRAFHEKTGIPLYHLDMMYWNADRTHVTREALIAKLMEILPRACWIIDGNYGSTMELRLGACDTVILLDYPTELCLEGIRQRAGKPRPDMPWVEATGAIDEEFTEFVRNYNEFERPKVMERLKKFRDKAVFIFRNRSEADAYLGSLKEHTIL
jgi:adenylate kinase family enzyme